MLIFFKNKKKKFGKFRSSCKHYHFHETHAVNDNTCNEIDQSQSAVISLTIYIKLK